MSSAMDENIISLQMELSAVACDDLENPRLHNKLAQSLFTKYQEHGHAVDDIAAAVFQATTAVKKADILDSAERDEMAANLSLMVFEQWNRLRTPESLEAALERGLQTTTLLPNSSPYLPKILNDLARALLVRGRTEQDEDDLEAALQYARDAADRQGKDHPSYPKFCCTISGVLFQLSRLRSSLPDLEEAISQLLESKKMMRADHPMQNGLANQLATYYRERFRYTMNYEDIVKASTYSDQQNSMLSPVKISYENQDIHSFMRILPYRRSGDISDLDKAIRETKSLIRGACQSSPSHARLVVDLTELFNIRFAQLGKVRDAEEGVKQGKKALELALANSIKPLSALHCLCWSLTNHNHELDVQKEVDDTIAVIQRTKNNITDAGDQADILSMWGMLLSQRFKQNQRNVSDLEDGIAKLEEALKLSASKEQNIETLDILTGCFHDHFIRTGEERSMNEAVSTGRRLVSLLDQNHRDRHRLFTQFARQLTNRSLRTGDTAELDEAITIYEDVNKALPDGHFLRLRNADALAVMYDNRYERRGHISDNDMAIATLKSYIECTTPGSQERGVKLLNLGGSLSRRFLRTKNLDHLEEAIATYKEALQTNFTEANQGEKASCLYSLAGLQRRKYEFTGKLTSLDASIGTGRLAVATLPETHPELASVHYVLGRSLESRARTTEHHRDIDSALDNFKTACFLQVGQPYKRIAAAHRAMIILGERNDWIEAERIADVAVSLIPRACTRKLDRDDQVHALQDISEVSTDACSISLRLGKVGKALQHIEYGRGLILGYLIDEQSDLSDLRSRDCSLAHEYKCLRSRAKTSPTSTELDQIYQAMDVCESKIRQVEGFERFLLPPSLEELQAAAYEGPIVIVNASRFGTDAIIITEHCLKAVELPGMSFNLMMRATGKETEDQSGQRDIRPQRAPRLNDILLDWLWSACVHPILKQIAKDLGQTPTDTELPRVWWIGTGFANSLPFHAATSSNAGASGSALNLVISSYTTTIKALQNARHRASRGQKHNQIDPYKLLVVTMPSTPGVASLSGVTREKQAIKTAVDGVYNITDLEKPSARQVLDGIQDAQIVHFACHGASDPLNPLQSHLLLQTSDQDLDKLTVKSLMDAKVQTRAWIAYLSACSTAQVSATNLNNEGLHATSAFQVAGFGHVIGSMWPVSDDVSVEVAELFYKFLSKSKTYVTSPNRLVAEALRNALLEVRKRHPKSAGVWGHTYTMVHERSRCLQL